MIMGSLGANAIEPITSVGAASAIGRNDVPASRVSQIPPFPKPTSQWPVSLGSVAMDATRPALRLSGTAALNPRCIGAGPIRFQTGTAPAVLTISLNCRDAIPEKLSITTAVKV